MRGFIIFTQILICISHNVVVNGYGTGAPTVACDSLVPNHGPPPQTTPSPYKVVLQRTKVQATTPLEITLTSKNGKDEFQGFLIQVRGANPDNNSTYNKPLGDFENNPSQTDARVLACNATPKVAMTHTDPDPKTSVTVRWIPRSSGDVRVHTTFVFNVSTYWANEMHDQIIQVVHPRMPFPEQGGHPPIKNRESSDAHQNDRLCSSLQFNATLKAEQTSSNPYRMIVGPVETSTSKSGNAHTISQMGLMWINVTSDYGTPILKMFMIVRRVQGGSGQQMNAGGRFIGMVPLEKNSAHHHVHTSELINCYGVKDNAILLVNQKHNKAKISDISIQWQAPQDEVGDYEVVATALSEEDQFWDRIGEDPLAGKIKVVKRSVGKEGKLSGSESSSSTAITGGNSLNTALKFALFFMLALSVVSL